MYFINLKRIAGLAILLVGALSSTAFGRADDQRPFLPSNCQTLQVSQEFKLLFHAYAIGVQIYRWNGASWDFVEPSATLYADANLRGKIGDHFGGPTWQTNSGSNVVAKRADGCTVDESAVQWLLLEKVTTEGPGLFKRTALIQRLNTVGGVAPSTPGLSIGEEARVPYTAEYFFYRKEG